jgi:hypothetical protein
MIRAGLAIAAGVALLPAVTRAQEPLQFTVGATAAQQIVQSLVDPNRGRFTGAVVGVEGGLVSNRLLVRVRYAEGHVSPKSATAADGRDVVEGEALVGFRALPWLTLWGGPSARAYTMGNSDQRWIIWTARAAARGTLLPGRMQSFVEVYGAFSGSVGDPALHAGGRGLNGGLELRLSPSKQFWGRLGYKMESTHAEGMRETVETFSLSLLYGLPQ